LVTAGASELMMPKYGNIWTYYPDTNIYNFLVKDPAGPAALDVLKRAKQQRKAYTYASMYNVSELAAAYPNDHALAVRLLSALRSLVRPHGLKDTPELLRAELRHLQDRSALMQLIEPRDSEYTREYLRVLDDLIERPAQNAGRFQEAADDVARRKRDWVDMMREARREFGVMIGTDPLPFERNIEAFFAWSVQTNYIETIVTGLRPPDMRGDMTGAEIARRLDETIGYRSMVYFMLSAIGYQGILQEDRPHFGDAIDQHHGIYAGYFDIFVSNDEDCRKFATKGLRNGDRVMSLDEFLVFLGTL
jgi:hypothetical protein